ncbi:hypothetical protein GC163_16820 [bacterium]|nr:hypothetical protein [bacterium]
MWCPTCLADVAAELSADERRLHCARCGTETGLAASGAVPTQGPRLSSATTRDATELLARWSAEGIGVPKSSPATSRIAPPPTPLQITDPSLSNESEAEHQVEDRQPIPQQPIRRMPRHIEPLSNWVSVGGQMAAYLGVLLLTCGTALIVVSQFGGTMQQAITGWLLTTVGQMLLFVGVVTLVSHGLEQHRRDIAREMKRFRKLLRRKQPGQAEQSDRRAA